MRTMSYHERSSDVSTEPVDRDDLILVTGGGGFIGGHLVAERIHEQLRKR